MKQRSSIQKRILYIAIPLLIVAVAGYIFLRSVYVVPVIMYHNIDEHYKESKLSVSPGSFERQMRFLRERRYNIVSLDELVSLLSSKRFIPYKTIAITFDDGYMNNYINAFPILRKYNIPACIFVVVDEIGRQGYMDWGELRDISDDNISIGSHALSHSFLPDVKDGVRLKKEIFESRQIIKSRLPNEGGFFAYCGGGFNEKIRQLVIDAGYKGACATNPGKNYPKNDVYAIKRLRISRTSDNLFVFWLETSGFYTWIKEHRDEE